MLWTNITDVLYFKARQLQKRPEEILHKGEGESVGPAMEWEILQIIIYFTISNKKTTENWYGKSVSNCQHEEHYVALWNRLGNNNTKSVVYAI